MLPRIHYPSGDAAANGDEASGETATESDWWANAIEEDSFMSPFPFDASENGLWNGRFVPPPPRPPFLDDTVSSDGLTTCDLCTWAWRDRNAFSLDGTIAETAGELGWTFSLIIVSGLSALLGAIIMISVIKCKRSSSNSNGSRSDPWWACSNRSNTTTSRLDALTKPQTDNLREGAIEGTTNSGVRTWLTKTNRRQPAIPNQLDSPTHPSVGNHYSHMDDSYSPTDVGEALYSELDRESIRSDNPFSTYNQNNTYSRCVEPYQDMPVIVSSAPSSAYYSDMSNTERAYEVVDLTVMSSSIPNWNKNAPNTMPPKNRALEVSETTRLHKDTSAAGHMTTRACMEQNRLQLQNKNYSKQKPDSAFGDSFS